MSMSTSSCTDNSTAALPLSDPRCASDCCDAFATAHALSQASVSYAAQYLFGHYVVWYFLALLLLASLLHLGRRVRNHHPPRARNGRSGSSSLAAKCTAVVRTVQYTHLPPALHLPALLLLVFLLATGLFLLLLTFLPRPYFRARRGFGSPPLAVRSGLMAISLTPIIVALAGKVNLLTLLTGIPHTKLNVLHRWTSYFCLFLSIVHTVPFLVQPLWEGGPAALRKQYYKTGGFEFTGTPPLGMLVGLCVLSVPWVRERWYTVFYRLHVPLYGAYLGTMFWHAGDEGDSWVYLWASLAVYLASVLGRLFWKWQTFGILRESWFSGFPARLEDMPDGLTKMVLLVPLELRWTPGQHVFLRMPHLSWAQNHPYTIANLARTPHEGEDRVAGVQEMVFLVRAHKGLTLALQKSVAELKSRDRGVEVHVDGPYGGLVEDVSALYQAVMCVAGGSGISACLPLMHHVAERIRARTAMVTSMQLVWVVRRREHLEWVADELEAVQDALGDRAGLLKMDFYITDAQLDSESESEGGPDQIRLASPAEGDKEAEAVGTVLAEAKHATTPDEVHGSVHHRKPFLPDMVPSWITARRVVIFSCGPGSLTADLSNATAKAQRLVLRNECDEITLHTEGFGW